MSAVTGFEPYRGGKVHARWIGWVNISVFWSIFWNSSAEGTCVNLILYIYLGWIVRIQTMPPLGEKAQTLAWYTLFPPVCGPT